MRINVYQYLSDAARTGGEASKASEVPAAN
jgi:hypothetical protein